MTLPPAEQIQAEPSAEPTDFWLGFIAGVMFNAFWIAVAAGLWAAYRW